MNDTDGADWAAAFHDTRMSRPLAEGFSAVAFLLAYIVAVGPLVRMANVVVVTVLFGIGMFVAIAVGFIGASWFFGRAHRRRFLEVCSRYGLERVGGRPLFDWEPILFSVATSAPDGTRRAQISALGFQADAAVIASLRLDTPRPQAAVVISHSHLLYGARGSKRDYRKLAAWLLKTAGGEAASLLGHWRLSEGLSGTERAMFEPMLATAPPDEMVVLSDGWLHVIWQGPLTEVGAERLLHRPGEWAALLDSELHPVENFAEAECDQMMEES